MSSLRKMAQLLAMLACVGLSTWAIGCGDPNATNGTTDGAAADGAALDAAADTGMGAGDEAGSATSDGGGEGVETDEVPPTPDAGDETPTEGE